MSLKFDQYTEPIFYTVPSFPSLYWPINPKPGEAQYLYSLHSIWFFTLLWTFITIGTAHLCAAAVAVLMQFVSALQRRNYLRSEAGRALTPKNRKLLGEHPLRDTAKWVGVIPLMWLSMGAIEAFLAGSLVGVALGAVYNAGYLRMSTWTPLVWGIINMLILVVGSFRIQGGL